MMRLSAITATACFAFLTVSCESVRTVYDSSGNEVKERKAGENSTLGQRFTSGFGTKKNEMGLEMASSKKVSSFQSAIDDSRAAATQSAFQDVAYKDKKSAADADEKKFTESVSTFTGVKTFKDSSKVAYSAEDVPAFMKGGRGITPKSYADAKRKSSASGLTYDSGEAYEKIVSATNTGQRSGYFESKPEVTKKIYSKDEYTQKTIEETRGLLKRENDQY